MSNAWDRDDPRNWDNDGYEDLLCAVCGGPCDGRCSQPAKRCAICDGTGEITFSTTPYGRMTIPCPGLHSDPRAESEADIRARVVGHARRYLTARGLEYPKPPEEDE